MRIGIVNDTAFVAEALRRIVAAAPEHEVAWVAHGGAEALRLCADSRPDLVLMDLVMPEMDGVEATRQIMQHAPCAILIVTAAPDDSVNQVFRALGAGALDVTAVPRLQSGQMNAEGLLAKIRTIGKLLRPGRGAAGHNPPDNAPPAPGAAGIQTLLAIGASTGGPLALAQVLSGLIVPATASVVIVQHIDKSYADTFANWLGSQVDSPVQVIGDDSALVPGRILVAKSNDHLVLDENARLRYSAEPRDYPYRPSVDVFFRCVAECWHNRAIGVLLTGMGRDGAAGMLAMRRAGMLTVAQDQATSAVYGMPRAAAELDAADLILPLQEIAATVRERLQAGKTAETGSS